MKTYSWKEIKDKKLSPEAKERVKLWIEEEGRKLKSWYHCLTYKFSSKYRPCKCVHKDKEDS